MKSRRVVRIPQFEAQQKLMLLANLTPGVGVRTELFVGTPPRARAVIRVVACVEIHAGIHWGILVNRVVIHVVTHEEIREETLVRLGHPQRIHLRIVVCHLQHEA